MEKNADQSPEPDATSLPELRKVSEEELGRILGRHEKWVLTGGQEGARANLANIDLQGAKLQEVDLREATLEGANLRQTDLSGTDLRSANLRGANFLGARLHSDDLVVNLQSADLRDANLHGAWLIGANLEGADLRGANLENTNFHDVRLLSAHLQGVVLTGANLEGVQLQKANLFRARLWRAKLAWANLQGANFQLADFWWADLHEAKLQAAVLDRARLENANLQGAVLIGAKLMDANLVRAKLHGADLSGANLQGANLRHADFETVEAASGNGDSEVTEPANLTGADFRGADLGNAKLSNVIGLQADKLGGANLSGATVPPHIDKFDRLTHVEDISKTARGVFLGLIGGCFYSWLTIATTNDPALLTNSASTPLPIIQTKIPIAGFFLIAPFILLALYIYLQMYLQRLWSSLASLPARFTDSTALDEKAYPWLLTSLVRAHMPLLTKERPPLWWLQIIISYLAAWLIVPLTLVAFWMRYLPRHDWPGTILLTVAVMAAFWVGIATHRLARDTLSYSENMRQSREAEGLTVSAIAVASLAISVATINGNAPFEFLGFTNYADFREKEVSIKPAEWRGRPEDVKLVKGANLQNANLRYANAESAFMVRADLRNANIQRGNLLGANLQEANLYRANLLGADLRSANLRKALLNGASFIASNLSLAKLQEVSAWGVALAGADLNGARLQEADLRGANLWRAKLFAANLQGAKLGRANLQETDFTQANLQGADLEYAALQGAELRRANLEGALNLTQDQLDKACGSENTVLPTGLAIEPCSEPSRFD